MTFKALSLVFYFLSICCDTTLGANKELDQTDVKHEFEKMSKFNSIQGRFQQKKKFKTLSLEISTEGSFAILRKVETSNSHQSKLQTEKTGIQKSSPQVALQTSKLNSAQTSPPTGMPALIPSVVLHWNITKPEKSDICIDSEGLVIESYKRGKLTKNKVRFSELAGGEGMESGSQNQVLQLMEIFHLAPEEISKSFKIFQKQDGSLNLEPRNQAQAIFSSIDLQLNNKGLIQKVHLYEKSQDELLLEFDHVQGSVSKDKFVGCSEKF